MRKRRASVDGRLNASPSAFAAAPVAGALLDEAYVRQRSRQAASLFAGCIASTGLLLLTVDEDEGQRAVRQALDAPAPHT